LIALEEIAKESKHEAVLCGIALLLGGNSEAQEKFLEFFEKD
jgi:hypothetical protein